jgi:hypothetical protein
MKGHYAAENYTIQEQTKMESTIKDLFGMWPVA